MVRKVGKEREKERPLLTEEDALLLLGLARASTKNQKKSRRAQDMVERGGGLEKKKGETQESKDPSRFHKG